MRADAGVVAAGDGRGGTRLVVLRGESPLLLRRTGQPVDGWVTVHLVGGAAGPLRGDELRLNLEVGPGARLEMRSVAASLALPGRPAPPSRLTITASVAAGGMLRWLPEPLIAAAGCDHIAVTRVDVAEGGTLLWRDDLVCGRHEERSGTVRQDTMIRYGGVTLYRHELSVGPGAPGWEGAAVLGGRAVGTLVAVGTELPLGTAGPDAAVMPLAGGGTLASAVGADIRSVAAALNPLCEQRAPLPTAWRPASAVPGR
ncbi:urease accessory protein UreD [Actinoplanes sp. NPDC023801]|uniref:urease accessory protein UreD n=1 Tax=Actinoplanes sp. NPDC023801 TaxID=3154595 RepID=UPI003404011C